jgi:hypothetical protein
VGRPRPRVLQWRIGFLILRAHTSQNQRLEKASSIRAFAQCGFAVRSTRVKAISG